MINQENSKKLVKSDYFGLKPVFLSGFGVEDPEKSGHSTSFTGIFTKQALLAQPFPKIEKFCKFYKWFIANLVLLLWETLKNWD